VSSSTKGAHARSFTGNGTLVRDGSLAGASGGAARLALPLGLDDDDCAARLGLVEGGLRASPATSAASEEASGCSGASNVVASLPRLVAVSTRAICRFQARPTLGLRYELEGQLGVGGQVRRQQQRVRRGAASAPSSAG
jgi:hypothetical protein